MSHIIPTPHLACIAHRGGSGPFTENTIDAIHHALTLPVDAIEIDVWNLQGELLVTHDRRLGNTIPGNGRLIEQSPRELLKLPLRDGGTLATLPQILTLVQNHCVLNIEIKGPDCAELLARTLQNHCLALNLAAEQFIISSFDLPQLHRFMQLAPEFPRGVLVEGIPLDLARSCTTLSAWSLNAGLYFVNQQLVDDAHQRGCKVWVYTANHPDDWEHLSNMGVDGVFTDFPEALLSWNQTQR